MLNRKMRERLKTDVLRPNLLAKAKDLKLKQEQKQLLDPDCPECNSIILSKEIKESDHYNRNLTRGKTRDMSALKSKKKSLLCAHDPFDRQSQGPKEFSSNIS